jgi:hypothetical protein
MRVLTNSSAPSSDALATPQTRLRKPPSGGSATELSEARVTLD